MSTLYINRKTKRSCVTVAEFAPAAFSSAKARRKAAARERLRLQVTEGCEAVEFIVTGKADSAWLAALSGNSLSTKTPIISPIPARIGSYL